MALESGRRKVWASRSMADKPTDPHYLYFWLPTEPAVHVHRFQRAAVAAETIEMRLCLACWHLSQLV
eukprot:scaffold296969_cov17-Tisochrysis_lutea.AAC.1